MSDISLAAELARMTAYFQLRTIATHIGADPNAVDPDALTLTINATHHTRNQYSRSSNSNGLRVSDALGFVSIHDRSF